MLTDIENDDEASVMESETGYVIKSAVNYPNNEELKYEKIYLNNKKEIEKVEVFNENDIVKIKVTFDKVDLKAGLKESDFKLDDYVKEEEPKEEVKKEENKNTNQECSDQENCENKEKEEADDGALQKPNGSSSKNTANIENIIYPLYIPSNTYLTSSEKVETATGNRVILTFSGDKNFVLIEEATIASDDMEIIPVYGEPLLLSETIGALSANSLSWDVNDISYYLASTELSVSEMQLIANSLGNASLVAGIK